MQDEIQNPHLNAITCTHMYGIYLLEIQKLRQLGET